MPTYMASGREPVVESSSDLGSSLPITVIFTNMGPSTLPGASLVILLPLRNATDTGDYYYLYALNINVSFVPKSSVVSSLIHQFNFPSLLMLIAKTNTTKNFPTFIVEKFTL